VPSPLSPKPREWRTTPVLPRSRHKSVSGERCTNAGFHTVCS